MPSISGLSSGLNTDSIIQQLMSIERRPMLLLQKKQGTMQLRADAFRDVNTRLSALQSKLSDLLLSATFNTKKVTSTNEAVATATATAATTISSYDLNVTSLAKTHRIASDKQVDSTSALNLSGNIQINGKTVQIQSSFSLTAIKTAINDAKADVTASIIDNTLILESTKTGTANQIQLVDDNNVLRTLGVIATSGNLAIGATATATSLSGNPASNVVDGNLTTSWVEGTNNNFPDTITIDFGTAKAMNQLRIDTPTTGNGIKDFTVEYVDANGTRSTLATVTNNTSGTVTLNFANVTNVKQVIINVTGTQNAQDSEIFEVQAFNTNAFKNQLQAAADAQFTLNGLAMTRSSNTVTDAVDGVTFQLKGPGTATLAVNRDTAYTTDKIRAFVDQYNSTLSFISGKVQKEAILQGDSALVRLQTQLRSAFTDSVPVGAGNPYNQLALVGITVDKTGVMTLDETKLKTALDTNAAGVEALFKSEVATDGFNGVAARAKRFIEPYIRSGTGIVPGRQKMFSDQVKGLTKDIESFEARLKLREAALVRQFTNLEKALSTFNNQGAWLASQIAQLGSFSAGTGNQ